ncbi:MAG: HAD family hydrolase [Rikenellaceae bacterium]
MDQPITVAVVYDFDGTLAEGNMQEYDFIPSVGMSVDDFWDQADTIATERDADSVLSYMECMLTSARRAGVPITAERLKAMGRGVTFFDGVEGWFDLINRYAAARGVKLQHYVNSSGIREMIEGTSIASKFHKIYASAFLYDERGEAYWPAVAINYTNKTQFLFKINKGIETVHDSRLVNEFVPRESRPIPFQRMIFVGDGLTDIPSMRLVHLMGGHSIAVYDPNRSDKKEDMMQLIRERRVHYVCEANYTKESTMNTLVSSIIDKIATDHKLAQLQNQLNEEK